MCSSLFNGINLFNGCDAFLFCVYFLCAFLYDSSDSNISALISSRLSPISVYKLYNLDKNSAQTDEEKQRERQRNEREIKHAEQEAQHLKVACVLLHA